VPHSVEVPLKNGIRILITQGGRLRKLCRLQWSVGDASIYLIPYIPGDGMIFGGLVPKAGPEPVTFEFATQLSGSWGKVSLHQSGQVHATVDSGRTPAVHGEALDHVATITCFSPDGLPEVTKAQGPPKADLVLTTDDPSWTATQVPIFVTSDPRRHSEHKFRLCLRRPTLDTPLYVTLNPRSESHPEDNREPGVAIFGWGAGTQSTPGDVSGVFVMSTPRLAATRS
jgi:hypothetical protein